MRKIIQIAFKTTIKSDDNSENGSVSSVWGYGTLYALCNDGTILFYDDDADEWKVSKKSKPIPQGDA